MTRTEILTHGRLNRPALDGIDWTAPAVDCHDEAARRFAEVNGHLPADERLAEAESFADRMVARLLR